MAGPDATRILTRSRAGDTEATEQLLELVYADLRALAADFMRRERANHTLQPTALVHETYIRMIRQREVGWEDRAHFISVASHTIRRVLVDHARKHGASKRGGGRQAIALDDAPPIALEGNIDVLALEQALTDLGNLHERQQRIVELRYFGGLTVDETADVLGVSPRTVKAEWALARAWLKRRLGG